MKNLKLTAKMLIMSSVLMAAVLVVAYVALIRLSAVNSQIRQMVNSTNVKSSLAAEVHLSLLSAIRAQKNAILAPDDQMSRDFAATSRTNLTDAKKLVGKLSELVSRDSAAEQKQAVEAAGKALDEMEMVNNSALDLAVQNTNLKAKSLVFGDLQRTTEALSTQLNLWVDEIIAGGNPDLEKMTRLQALHRLTAAVKSIQPNALRHIESSNADEMSAQEKVLTDLQDQIQQGLMIASGGDIANQVEVRTVLSDMKETLSAITQLSRLDTNNRSAELSLKESKVATDECVKQLGELDVLLKAEALAGRDMSEAAFTSAVWWILSVAAGGVIVGGLLAWIVTQSVTKPVAEVCNVARVMADGDLRRRVQLHQKDEVGQLSDATNSLADALTNIVAEIQKVSGGLAGSAADLTGVSDQLLLQSETASIRSSSVASASEQL